MKRLMLIVFVLCVQLSIAQTSVHGDYDWTEKGVLLEVPEDLKNEQEVILKKRTFIEYLVESDLYVEYQTSHEVTWVNSNDAVERNNRIYLQVNQGNNIIYQKARVITPNGKVIEMQESDIKVAKNEENGQGYQYFALEGLEVGSQIEYLYRMKGNVRWHGQMIDIQSSLPQVDVGFELHHPWDLEFDYKGFNGITELEADSTHEEVFVQKYYADRVEPLIQETFASYSPHLQKVLFKLDNMLNHGERDVHNYDNVARVVQARFMMAPEKKAAKVIKSIIKDAGISEGDPTEEKVRKLETYLKMNYSIVNSYVEELEDIVAIQKNKYCNEDGMLKLFGAALNVLDVNHEFVLTTDRTQLPFDKDFEAYNMLQNSLIYFPELDDYLAPSEQFTSLGVIYSSWRGNYGLFVKSVELGSYITAVGEVKYIEEKDFEDNFQKMNIHCSLDLEEDLAKISYDNTSNGQYAMAYQSIFPLLDKEQQEEVAEGMAKFSNENAEIVDVEVSNVALGDFGRKPMQIEFTISSDEFVSRAGDKILFKMGEVIGPQMEMYQSEERKLPVDVTYNHGYHRIISFDVPEGYEVSNLEDLKFDIEFDIDGEKALVFTSEYSLEGNKLTVENHELYKKSTFEVDDYEKYRQTINGAADFNKVVLVLVKS